jgi:hypothetical protein
MLLEADKTPTFNRFFELSAELRQTIYEYYVGDLGAVWYHYLKDTRTNALCPPVSPPLAQASQMLRYEVLPVFYNSCRFRLLFTPDSKCDSWRLSDHTRQWLNRLSTEHLGCIRRLEIQTVAGTNVYHVNLNRGEESVQRRQRQQRSPVDVPECGIRSICDGVVKRIRARESLRLTMEDILEIERAVDKSTMKSWRFENPARPGDL